MISTHTHIETPFTASTIDSFIERSKVLGRGAVVHTDIGTMSEALRVYKTVSKAGLTYIPGLEMYVKDDSCPSNKAFPSASYFTITAYAEDQESFHALIKVASSKKSNYQDLNENDFPIFGWDSLEYLSKFKTSFVLCGPHSLLVKPALAGKQGTYIPETINRLKDLGRPFYIGLMAGKESAVWSEQIKLTVFNPEKEKKGEVYLNPRDKVETLVFASGEKAKKVATMAADLTNGRHSKLLSFVKNGVKFNSGVEIIAAVREERFKPLSRDFVKDANKLGVYISKKFGIPLVSSDYAFMSEKEDKPVQDVKVVELRKQTAFYMLSEDEYTQSLSNQGVLLEDIRSAIKNTKEWSLKFHGFKLKYDIRVPGIEAGTTPAKKMMGIIKEQGRMPWGNKVYEERLKRELQVLAMNPVKDLLPYFFPIIDLQQEEMDNGILTGPGRGSGAGSLLNYLTGITQVDPIKEELSFERFINEDRIAAGDWPDIDGDRGDRSFLAKRLEEKYGNRSAQISTRSMMRLKSSILDVNRYLNGSVEKEIETFSKNLPSAPQGVSDQQFVFGYEDSDGNHHAGLIEYDESLQDYVAKRPEEWEIVRRCLGVTRNISVHASAFLIADIPIEEFVPMVPGTRVTQYEAKGASAAGGIKYDFLVVSNLLDIQKCLQLINKKNGEKNKTGYFSHDGKKQFIWDLPREMEVFKSIWDGNTAGLFQINTASMAPAVKKIKPKTMLGLSDILALIRPGTMDAIDPVTGRSMTEEYIERLYNRSKCNIPELEALIPETFGVIVYQEQASLIARELAGMDPVTAEKMRRALSKKLKVEVDGFKPMFIEGALKKVSETTAHNIWDQIETGSRYSFNKSHSISYAYITYATMFLRHHYPLEFWTAVLSNADKKEIKEVYYKHTRHLLAPPDINKSTDDMIIDYETQTIRSKLTVIKGLSENSVKELMAKRPYLDVTDLVKKETVKPALARKLIVVGVMDSLFEKNKTLIQKLQEYEDALELHKYHQKIALGKKPKLKAASVDPEFLSMSPLDEFKLKKEILPTMDLRVSDIVFDISPKIKRGPAGKYLFESPKKDHPVLDGEGAEKLNNSEITNPYGVMFCVPASILSMKEFTYQNGEKRALKLILDSDGYNREAVLWPDYGTGKLSYPDIEEGDVAIFLMKKKEGRDPNIVEIFVDFL